MSPFITESDLNLTEEQFIRVSDAIYDHCGINLHDGKKTLVRARLAKRLRQSNFKSVNEYINFALSSEGSKEFHSLVDSISTNLTSFFREKVHFDYLKNKFLPPLLSSGKRSIRVWSAGCSSGEEPYSIAITLKEHGLSDTQSPPYILATDISTRVLKKAVNGVFPFKTVERIEKSMLKKYFLRGKNSSDHLVKLKPEITRMVTFKRLNFIEDFRFDKPFDFIFCRNVMIYFDRDTREILVNRFFNELKSGGYLIIGHSESLNGIKHPF